MGWSLFKAEAKLSVVVSDRISDKSDDNSRIFVIKVANIGKKTAMVKSIRIKPHHGSFELSPKFLGSDNLPYKLEEGENCLAEISIKDLIHGLIDAGYVGKTKLLVEAEDSEGKVHRSMKSLMFDLNKLRKKYYLE